MSRPNISYPTPIPGPSSYADNSNGRSSLEPSVMSRGASESLPQQKGSRQPSGASRGLIGQLDSHITRLLVTTKQLLQGLNAWAVGDLDEEGISDIYVRLGNGFEVCVTQLLKGGIATAELERIPQDLRECLEEALANEPSEEALKKFLPNIRDIIYDLLNGLKQKQAAYKRMIQERQPEPHPPPSSQASRVIRRPEDDAHLSSARSGVSTTSQISTYPGPIPSQLPATKVPSSYALAERERTQRPGGPARPPPPDAFRPARMRPPEGAQVRQTPLPQPHPIVDGLTRHNLSDNPVPTPPPTQPTISLSAVPPKPTPPHPDRFSRDSFGNPRPISRFSADSDITNGSPIRSPVQRSPPAVLQTLSESTEAGPSLAPSLPTLNLPPSGIQLNDTPLLQSSMSEVPPETRATLAALGHGNALERRASKRYSSYTFQRMLPSSPNSKSSSASSPSRPSRRADRPPPMPAFPEGIASNNLIALTGRTGSRTSSPEPDRPSREQSNGDNLSAPARSRSPSSSRTVDSYKDASEGGSVRYVKTPENDDIGQHATPRPRDISSSEETKTVTVYLRFGAEIRKAKVELPATSASLRLLFMEKFEYEPEGDEFPTMYLEDDRIGKRQYVLEDMEDVRDGCLVVLDNKPLDRQHFDQTLASLMRQLEDFSTVSKDLRDVKATLDAMRRAPSSPAASLLNVSGQLIGSHTSSQTEGLSLSHVQPQNLAKPHEVDHTPFSSAPTALPQLISDRRAQVQAHQTEVQSVRRDLAIMRQIQTDFGEETRQYLAKVRNETTAMQGVLKSNIGGSRALVDQSKVKLETQCSNAIQAVEDISDILDIAREDALKRYVAPSRKQMASITADLQKAAELVESFTKEVTFVEPTWKSTWHSELKRVADEQSTLAHQKKLGVDLKKDIGAANEVIANVKDFFEQRQTGIGRQGSRGFRPPTPDQTTGGMPHLLMEIRTKDADPLQRIRAIEAQQKAREKELANRSDEFTDELSGFVQSKRLRKTGGTDETERSRQRRQDQTIKRMLTEDSPGQGQGQGSPMTAGIMTPQITGASMLNAQVTGGSKLSPQMTGGSVVGSGGPAGVRPESRAQVNRRSG